VLVFIIIILWVEHKQLLDISEAVWIPSIWLLYSASKQLGTWLNIRTAIEAGSPPDRIFLVLLGFLGVLILFKRNFLWPLAWKNNRLLILIAFYMLLSALWSKTPGICFRRWGREIISLIIACILLSEKSPLKALFSAFRKMLYIALPLSLLLIKYYPFYGRQYDRWTGGLTWVGVASQKNGLALLCAFGALFLIFSIWQDLSRLPNLKSKFPIYLDIFMLFLCIYLFMGPERTLKYSATSTLSMFMGLASLTYFAWAIKRGAKVNSKIITVSLIIIIFIGTYLPFSRKIFIKEIPTVLGRDNTLTGRTQIWNSLVPYALNKLILGYGFGGFWTTSLREQIASHSHNGYLDTILDLGLIGLILFSVFLTSISYNCVRLINMGSNPYLIFLPIILAFLIHNIGETSLGNLGAFPSSLIILFSFLINEEVYRISAIPNTRTLT